MSAGPTISWLPEERIDELKRFVGEQWRADHVLQRDEALLRWQHKSPNTGQLSVLVAEQDERLVAMLGVIRFTACIRGDEGRGGWFTNWIVAPDARGQGLGGRLARHLLEHELDFAGALDANEATQHVLAKADWELRPRMPRWILPVQDDAYTDLVGSPPPRRRGHVRTSNAERWSASDHDRWDAVFRDRISPGFVGCSRDAAYIDWRFVRHPLFRYEILVADAGLAVYRVERVRDSPHSVLRVVDLLGDERTLVALSDALARAADEAAVAFADFFCTTELAGAPLEQAGFVREGALPSPPPRLFQPLEQIGRPLASLFWPPQARAANGLYVSKSDSDLDRPN